MSVEPNATDTDLLESAIPRSSRLRGLEQPNRNGRAFCPLITLAIPTRNRASIVTDAVRRALAQSYSNIEVLVSDNASTDETLVSLRSIIDPRLRILTSPRNIGANANYAKCIREAKGSFLLIVPDDDRISGTFLEKCVRLLNEEPGLRAVVAAYGVFFTDENRHRPAILSRRLSTGVWDGSEILKEVLGGQLGAIMLSTVFRTELLRSWPNKYRTAQEHLAMTQILLSGRAGLLNERCATLTIHKSSISTRLGLDCCFRETQEVMEVISSNLPRTVSNEKSCRELQTLAARYVAKKLMDCLVLYRRQGATLYEVGRQLGIWRAQSRQCTPFHFMAALRLKTLVLILLPAPMTRLLLSIRHAIYGRGLMPCV
jgi:hypothetical protein